MKNVNILLALSLFSYLRTSFDSAVINQPASTSNTDIRQSADLFKKILGCDLSCMSGEVVGSVAGQISSVLALLQMACTRMGCAAALEATDISPSVPVHQGVWPNQKKKDVHRFEAPDMLAGAIIES